MTTLSPKPYKGTRDYTPQQKAVQQYIFSIWRTVVESYGYQEYGTPLLEPLEMYAAKSGDELANEQTYAFEDRGGRRVAIRPEMTPSVSRVVAAQRQELAYPARLFSIANFMRYERPQRGREREFWQLNIDMFGADTAAADAEILQLADDIVRAFGADETMYEIHVNHRALISAIMHSYLELDETAASALMKVLDRRHKITPDAFTEQVSDVLHSDEKRVQLEAIIAAKHNSELPSEVQDLPEMKEVARLFALVEALGIATVRFDITLMRGLDYYTGMVFEVFDTHPENNRSMFGGGRYDGLVGMFDVEPLSAVGFAPGLTTTELFLQSHNLLPEMTIAPDVYVVPTSENELKIASELARQLRPAHTAEVDVTDKKLDKKMKTANKKNARFVVVIGEREAETGVFAAKNLTTGETIEFRTADELTALL